jgi:hypothetical protein
MNGILHGAADAITHLFKSNVECILPMELEIVCGMGCMWGKALNESLRITNGPNVSKSVIAIIASSHLSALLSYHCISSIRLCSCILNRPKQYCR